MRISVIIPAYRSAATIVEALDSVLAQDVADLEIIVVDDCSPDDVQSAVEVWKQGVGCSPPPVSVLQTPRNMGPAGARNIGLCAARGKWIAFLDADDAWLPGKLIAQLNVIDAWRRNHRQEEPVFVCGGNTAYEERPDKPTEAIDLGSTDFNSAVRGLQLSDFAVSNPVTTSTVLASRAVIEAAGGFDEQFCGPEDYDLWIRIAAGDKEEQSGTPDVAAVAKPWPGEEVAPEVANPRLSRRGYEEKGAATSTINHQPSVRGPRSAVRGLPSSPLLLHLSIPLARYRSVPGSLSMDDRRFLPQVLRVIDKAYGPRGALKNCRCKRKARAYHFLAAAWSAAEDRRIADAARLFVRSLFEWPFSFRPQKQLPWGRIKILKYMARRTVEYR